MATFLWHDEIGCEIKWLHFRITSLKNGQTNFSKISEQKKNQITNTYPASSVVSIGSMHNTHKIYNTRSFDISFYSLIQFWTNCQLNDSLQSRANEDSAKCSAHRRQKCSVLIHRMIENDQMY